MSFLNLYFLTLEHKQDALNWGRKTVTISGTGPFSYQGT